MSAVKMNQIWHLLIGQHWHVCRSRYVSRSHFKMALAPTTGMVLVSVLISRLQSVAWDTAVQFIHSFTEPLDRWWVVVPSILLNHWLCPMQHQRRVLCRLPDVASTDGEASHVDVSTAACCRGGDQILPWQPDAVPCGPQWLLEVVLRDQTSHDVVSWSCHKHFLGQSGLWWWRWWWSRTSGFWVYVAGMTCWMPRASVQRNTQMGTEQQADCLLLRVCFYIHYPNTPCIEETKKQKCWYLALSPCYHTECAIFNRQQISQSS